MSDDRIPLTLNLRSADCPACGYELRVKVVVAHAPGETRPSTCPRCQAPLVTWAEEAHYGPPEITPLPTKKR
jgi:predicted Zn-ribbon and HTH transcriptional regulator